MQLRSPVICPGAEGLSGDKRRDGHLVRPEFDGIAINLF